MRAKDVLGRYGEDLAAGYLESPTTRVVDRNWRYPSQGLHAPLCLVDVMAVLDDGVGEPADEHLKGVG